ncbi:hypothetical protein M8J76_013762 [Diaphorina citri]|nr:hypothetical protein M8J75_006497 [Diaphorina citri]KAI5737455.1 hypothetical protein M8J76_013762 [Diaphorina citri]KAI5743745.1 hypothetical protein M8J77_021688 [Diaphorina citri]
MVSLSLQLVGLLLLVFVSSSHQWHLGPCPSKHYVQSFRPYYWEGRWFEYLRKETPVWESYSKCNVLDFGSNSNNLSMVIPVAKTPVRVPLKVKSISNEERDAHFNWIFKFPVYTSEKEVYVLATNYYDWAVVWSCQNYYVFNYQSAWILTREKKPSAQWVYKAIDKALELADLNIEEFGTVSHDNCPNMTSTDSYEAEEVGIYYENMLYQQTLP